MNFDYNSDMLLGMLFIACCALVAIKLIWDIGIPVLKIIIAFLLVYFAITWFTSNKSKLIIKKQSEPVPAIAIEHD